MKRIAGEVPQPVASSDSNEGADGTLGALDLSSTELGIEQPKECHGPSNVS